MTKKAVAAMNAKCRMKGTIVTGLNPGRSDASSSDGCSTLFSSLTAGLRRLSKSPCPESDLFSDEKPTLLDPALLPRGMDEAESSSFEEDARKPSETKTSGDSFT